MFGQQAAQELTQAVLRHSQNDPAEVLLFFDEQALTRFANNVIHQNVAETNATVILRLFRGQRIGTATTNRLDETALAQLVARARHNAEARPPDPDYPGLPEPSSYPTVTAFDPSTADYSPEARATAVGYVCRLAAEKKLNASGAFSTGTHDIVIANSRGVSAYHTSTQADFQTVVMAEDASGHAHSSGWRVADIPVEALGRAAIQKAEQGRHPRPLDPGEYTVVLDPYATADLLGMLNFYGMSGQTVLEGRSWMNDRLGQSVMSQQVNIWDDGLDAQGAPMPFDFEGVPKRRVDIVRNGVVISPVYDRLTAHKAGQTGTGHALPPTMRSMGPLATHLFMAPGPASIEALIQSTERGLYITRFWYTRLVHPRDCVVTGMTRDGVFMIEGGRLTQPMKNLRFTQSYVEALANVEAIGSETRLLIGEFGGFATRAPALKINHFKFTGSTV